jgi:S-adenosylmethionine:tRNA ribosyltransferase-isomerase
VKPARKVRPNEDLIMEGGQLHLIPGESLGGGMFRFTLRAAGDLDSTLASCGRAPLPPYIKRDGSEDPGPDRERYQTVFARVPGAVAAPTAGLHFAGELLDSLEEQGIRKAWVTLHVGEGTFAPVRCDDIGDHVMHSEEYSLPEATAEAVAEVRRHGGRVIAVGTTSARTLESRAVEGRLVEAGTGKSDIFLHPENPPRVIDALLTNFHLPESTLFMLVCGFAGLDEMRGVYAEAIAERYRFYSYGDAMLIL